MLWRFQTLSCSLGIAETIFWHRVVRFDFAWQPLNIVLKFHLYILSLLENQEQALFRLWPTLYINNGQLA